MGHERRRRSDQRIGISGVAPRRDDARAEDQDAFGNGVLATGRDAVRYAAEHGCRRRLVEHLRLRADVLRGVPAEHCDGNDADYLVAQRAVDYARDKGERSSVAASATRTSTSPTECGARLARDFFGFDFPGPWRRVPQSFAASSASRRPVTSTRRPLLELRARRSRRGSARRRPAPPGSRGTSPRAGTLIGAWSSTGLVGCRSRCLL